MAAPVAKPLCEVRVYSRRHRYAGTLDVLGHWQGSPALIDYKTGDPRDAGAWWQTAAYYGALLEMTANGDAPDGVVFDALTHRYLHDGKIFPSVTQVLNRAGATAFSKFQGGQVGPIMQKARDRGTAVHEAINYINEGDLDVAAFRTDFPEYWPYVSAWIKFVNESGFEFATAMDLPMISHIRRYAIRLKKDETYSVESYDRASDYAEFLALLHAQQIVDRYGFTTWSEVVDAA